MLLLQWMILLMQMTFSQCQCIMKIVVVNLQMLVKVSKILKYTYYT
jgi:hypothetical protein